MCVHSLAFGLLDHIVSRLKVTQRQNVRNGCARPAEWRRFGWTESADMLRMELPNDMRCVEDAASFVSSLATKYGVAAKKG